MHNFEAQPTTIKNRYGDPESSDIKSEASKSRKSSLRLEEGNSLRDQVSNALKIVSTPDSTRNKVMPMFKAKTMKSMTNEKANTQKREEFIKEVRGQIGNSARNIDK